MRICVISICIASEHIIPHEIMSCGHFTKLRDSIYHSCSTSCHCYSSNRHHRGCCNSTGQNRYTYSNRCNTDRKPTTAFKQISPIQRSIRVIACNWVVSAVGKEIVTDKISTSPQVRCIIRIDPPANLRIVITAGYVIESRLLGVSEAKTHNKYWYFYPTRSQRVIFGCAFLPG